MNLLKPCSPLLFAVATLSLGHAAPIFAQAAPSAAPATLHGLVADPSGAVIPGATISLTTQDGHTIAHTISGGDGSYQLTGIAPGTYVILASAPGFAPLSTKATVITAGQSRTFSPSLFIQAAQQNVQVNADTPTVSVDPDANANSVVIKGADLDALSDDPDELSNELTALAGPAAGPSGGQIFIDGFTAGQLPPKSAIREIRVNQNPYGAQFDKLGFGRVEILTKPGTDKYHGQVFGQGNARQFNTGNPFSHNIPDYHSYQYNGTVSGPINKNASFFFSAERRNIQDAAIVSAYRLAGEVNGDFAAGNYGQASDYATVNFNTGVNTPRTRTNISPRLDLQLGEKNTFILRYEYESDSEQNQGVGQFSLPSQAYRENSSENTVQISDTTVLSPKVINEARLQLLFDRSSQSPSASTPQVQVQGNQTFGGNSEQFINDHTDRYELSDLVEVALKNHALNIGGRLRATREANAADSSFNGLYTFGARACTATSNCAAGQTQISAATAYATTIQGLHNGSTFAQIQAAGGGPSQLVFVTGSPKAAINVIDGALFYNDDWKYRPNFTVSYGLRWETQNDIHDHSDFAPRVALAYGLMRDGKPTKDVIRAGFGFFYDRFGAGSVLQASRDNGVVQQEQVLQNPSCYFPDGLPATAAVLAQCAAGASSSTSGAGSSLAAARYVIGPNLHAPLNAQESVGFDHQLNKASTVSVTYIHSHGTHALDTINANASYSPTYDAALGNVYQYFSEGVYNQNQLFVNLNARFSPKLSLFGFYGLGYANSDANGASSNPSNSLNLKQDYGRAGFDVRNRLFLIGTYSAPHFFRFSPFVIANSGTPFNITLSQDLNGDSFFNDRPSYGTAGASGVVTNSYGSFNTTPSVGAKPIPVNVGEGPTLFSFNLRVSKTFGFGERTGPATADAGGPPRPGPGGPGGGGPGRGGPGGGGPGGGGVSTGRRYNLTINAQALNLFNFINDAPPTGTIDSPNFGRSNALAGGPFGSSSASRRIFLQTTLTF